MDRQTVHEYIRKKYKASPEYPWRSYPGYAVFRHEDNKKWFALVMDIPRSRLGLEEDEIIDVVNLKTDPVAAGSLRLEKGIFPAYHMNKDKWISVALDGSVDDEKIKMLLDQSFELTKTPH